MYPFIPLDVLIMGCNSSVPMPTKRKISSISWGVTWLESGIHVKKCVRHWRTSRATGSASEFKDCEQLLFPVDKFWWCGEELSGGRRLVGDGGGVLVMECARFSQIDWSSPNKKSCYKFVNRRANMLIPVRIANIWGISCKSLCFSSAFLLESRPSLGVPSSSDVVWRNRSPSMVDELLEDETCIRTSLKKSGYFWGQSDLAIWTTNWTAYKVTIEIKWTFN
jgi:hypothetical protein